MKRGLGYIFIFVLTALSYFSSSQAQNHAKNWYFGNKAGLVFNGRYPMPLTDGLMNSLEGVATISDSLGNLVCYTDGQTVWNFNHEVVAQELAGDPLSTMSATILPSRMHDDQYILFTTSVIVNGNDGPEVPEGGQYYIIDFSSSNPTGKIIDDYLSLGTGPVQQRSVEKFLGIPYPQSIIADSLRDPGYWLLTHEFARFTYKISTFEDGYEPYAEINIGQQHGNSSGDFGANRGSSGYITSNIRGNKIAVAIEGQKLFEVLRFNNETGTLREFMTLPAGDPAFKKSYLHQAYGVAFSPSGRFLYGTSRDEGILYQWDLESPNTIEEAYILRNNSEITCGALQLAPNGKIYLAIRDQDYLGVINHPDRLGKKAKYTEYGARLINNETGEGGKGGLGLPQFDMSDFEIQHFQYNGNCFGDTTRFMMAGGVGGGYSMNTTWTIMDPATGGIYWIVQADENIMGKWVFPHAGDYDIRVQSRYKGKSLDFVERITILPPPEVKLADDYTRLCRGDSLVLDAGNGAFYEWADESYRERRYTVTEADFEQIPLQEYRVKVTDYRGCVGWDTVHVEIKTAPRVDFEYTKAICGDSSGSATAIPVGGVENYYYRWEDFPNNKTNKISNVPGGDYVVYVTSKYLGCEGSFLATVPQLGGANVQIISSVDTTICAGTTVTLVVEGATLFEWINPEGQTGAEITVNPETTTVYRVKAISRDEESGRECITYAEDTIEVYPRNKPELGEDVFACEGDTIEVHAPDGYALWTWSNGMTGQDIRLLESYSQLALTVFDENNCPFGDTITATFQPAPDVDLGEDISLCTNEAVHLSGGEGDSYLWSTGATSASLDVLESDVYTLQITSFGCSNSDTVAVNIMNPDSLFIDSVRARDISCYGTSNGQIQVFAHGSGENYIYSIDNGQSFKDNNGIFTGLPAGYDYRVMIIEDSACTKSYPEVLSIEEPEEIEVEFRLVSPSCLTCQDGTIILTDISGGRSPYSVQWRSPMSTDMKISGLMVGEYFVIITDSMNCTHTAHTKLDLGFRIPNAFTPNNDGYNDRWDIKILATYKQALVQVYNSDGVKVFESPLGYPEPWDGTYQGNTVPMGTYYYVIQLSQDEKPFTGNLTILR
ncbi:MAG: gliding motility-associated C-terminal domain-containing protein [Bacteroidales bacterium]|nr:gliding motility-associated C-terminal domain-containing protein [Bacteroidales bacterium]